MPLTGNSQQWEVIYPQGGVEGDLFEGIVLPDNNFYVIGNDGWIFNASGELVEKINTSSFPTQVYTALDYFDIYFVTDSSAYMCFRNQILFSNNKGLTWVNQLELAPINSLKSSSYFTAIDFISETTGYAVGSFEKLFKTEDGGITWNQETWTGTTTPYTVYTDVQFIDNQQGYIAGYESPDINTNFGFQEFVLKTTDGGSTWTRHEIPATTDFNNIEIGFFSDSIGFATCSFSQGAKIFVTHDGGVSWTDVSPLLLTEVLEVAWLDEQIGIVFGKRGSDYVLVKSIDQGITWYEVLLPEVNGLSDYSVNDIDFLDLSTGYTIGAGGLIMHTKNAGESWEVVNEPNPTFSKIDVASDTVAYGSTGRELYQSVDGGRSWNYQNAPSDSLFYLISDLGFQDENNGLILGYSGQYIKTNDGLETFDRAQLPVNFFFSYSYLRTQGDTTYVVGTENFPLTNHILYTIDGGNHWVRNTIAFDQDFVNDFQLVAGGHLIIRNTNYVFTINANGQVLDTLFYSPDPIACTNFINREIGFVGTSADLAQGKGMKTADGGVTWTAVTIIPTDKLNTYQLNGVFFINADLAFAYGSRIEKFRRNAFILRSADGGQQWVEMELPGQVSGSINDIFYDRQRLYALSSQGKILQLAMNNRAPFISDTTFSLPPDPVKGRVVGVISASDPDGDELTYSIANGNPLNIFSIDPLTGDLTVVQPELLSDLMFPIELLVEVNDGRLTSKAVVTLLKNEITRFPFSSKNTYSIYPNPTTGKVTINWDEFKKLVITDLLGNELVKSNNKKVNLDALAAGAYLLILNGNKGKVIKCIIIKK